jgi:hypothetical protein
MAGSQCYQATSKTSNNLLPGVNYIGGRAYLIVAVQFIEAKRPPTSFTPSTGIFQLESSGLRAPDRIHRLLLVVAIAMLVSSMQGFAVSLAGERRRVDPHWRRGLSFARIGLQWLQQTVVDAGRALLAWIPIPLQDLEPCIPSRGLQRRQKQPWFTRVELPPPPHPTA